MATLPPDSNHETAETGMPRWVKVFVMVAIVLVVAFIILHLTGRAPMSHTP